MAQSTDAGLRIAPALKIFVEAEALPGTGIDPAGFWAGLAGILARFGPRNRALLDRRDALQARIDAWHKANPARPIDQEAYTAFLRAIGYLVPEPPPFTIATQGVDPEIATIAGPQLVVPVNNARYALNAANARWGSLYDALYGTDAIADEVGAERGSGLQSGARERRGDARASSFLDAAAPLAGASHADVVRLRGARRSAGRDARDRRRRQDSPTPRSSPAIRAMPPRPPRCCCATTACTSRSGSTAATRSAAPTAPAWPT